MSTLKSLNDLELADVDAILAGCEDALARDGAVDLGAVGFWRAVEAVKGHPEWVARFADRIGAIDRRAFERRARTRLSLSLGTTILSLGAFAGLLLAAAAHVLPARSRGPLLLASAAALLGTTHDLAHLLAGRATGIEFTGWFLDGPTRLQPGLKIDYASYLRTPARRRAWMHAAGALATKAVPFALLPFARSAGAPAWSAGGLAGIGVVQIATDFAFSVRHSDWKRFRREMRVARRLEQQLHASAATRSL
jgi:hypothetical protein